MMMRMMTRMKWRKTHSFVSPVDEDLLILHWRSAPRDVGSGTWDSIVRPASHRVTGVELFCDDGNRDARPGVGQVQF